MVNRDKTGYTTVNGRFEPDEKTVRDVKTGLTWCRDAAVSAFPLTWREAFEFIESLNNDRYAGFSDWRLPNRRELFSIVSHSHINPSLPPDHPFLNVFQGYYWSANTCARLPDQAWYVHFGGAKVYRGMKHASNMVWPVRGVVNETSGVYCTGQRLCHDAAGNQFPCGENDMQHRALVSGIVWPSPRFVLSGDVAADRLTGLSWTRKASRENRFFTWPEALVEIDRMNREKRFGCNNWRMPEIREIETLADLGSHSPALPMDHPFHDVSDFYWSGTTSMYEKRYAWAFYMKDGAVGVGFKENAEFSLWPVRGLKFGTDNGTG